MVNRIKLTPHKRKQFLSLLEELPNVSKAARAIGLSRRYMYEVKGRDKGFSDEWDDAVTLSMAKLEEAAWDRAINGAKRPIIHGGQITGWYDEPSDKLMQQLLAGNMAQYGNKQQVTMDAKVEVSEGPSPTEKLKALMDTMAPRIQGVDDE